MNAPAVPWKRVGVMGLGASGVAAAGFLARRGVEVIAADSKPLDSLRREASALRALGVVLKCGERNDTVFRDCEIVVTSPGVAGSAAELTAARGSGIRVIAEVELASRYSRGVLIGITGSNGKSTVSAMIGEMLRAAGVTARVCGNFGTPLTAVIETDMSLPQVEAQRVHYVVELSSFQLEGIESMRPRVAVLLNISDDHQDRYDRIESYRDAKARIFVNQHGDDIAILNWDDPSTRTLAERLAARLFPFSLLQDLEEGAVLRRQDLLLRRGGTEQIIVQSTEVPIPGRHNLENVLAAAAVAAHCGVAAEAMAAAVRGFRGLPHRLEFVREVEGVSYYNDSKATNIGATRRALEAFDVPLVLLLGGRDKGGDFESLRDAMKGRIRAIVTFGEAGPGIARRLKGAAPRVLESGSLSEAVVCAAEVARAGDVVLLAPGCASFDAFENFEKRGEGFRDIVRELVRRTGGMANAPQTGV